MTKGIIHQIPEQWRGPFLMLVGYFIGLLLFMSNKLWYVGVFLWVVLTIPVAIWAYKYSRRCLKDETAGPSNRERRF